MMTMRERRESSRLTLAQMLAAEGPHAMVVTVLTEPSGARRMEVRRLVDGRPLLLRAPYSLLFLSECLAEGVEVAYRSVLRLPPWEAP